MRALTEMAHDPLERVQLTISGTAALLLYSSHIANRCLSCHVAISCTILAQQQQYLLPSSSTNLIP